MRSIGIRSSIDKGCLWFHPGIQIVHSNVLADFEITSLTMGKYLNDSYMTLEGIRILASVLNRFESEIQKLIPRQTYFSMEVKPETRTHLSSLDDCWRFWPEKIAYTVELIRSVIDRAAPIMHIPAPNSEANWVAEILEELSV